MDPISDIPNIAMLAYRYGTIKKNEFKLVNELYDKRPNKSSFTDLLLNQGFATEYQIGLIKLIQDYHIIQKKGIEFGKIAVEKGLATEQDIEKALLAQKKAFKKAKLKKLIGDILVESKIITLEQRDQILEQQKEIEQRSSLLLKNEEDSDLSEYEQEFLKVKNLDKDFGKLVINKNLATTEQVNLAQKKQEKEFATTKQITILGDILVGQGVISAEQKVLVLTEQKRSEQKVKKQRSAQPRVSIAISDDNMEAHALLDKKEGGENITLAEIKAKLTQNKIKHGILSDSLIQCFIDKKQIFFSVARGDFPLERSSQTIEYLFDIKYMSKDQIKKGGSLAEQKISGQGLLGKDVLGNSVERDNFENRSASLIRCGFGTRLSKDNKKAFAKKTGVPSLSMTQKIHIHPVLNILEDADLRYGKIEQSADVNISGTLTDAFPVIVGHLKVNEIRGTDLEAQGNIDVAFGIIGAKIKCQGSIRAKYIKNSTIEAFGDVSVQHEIMDSDITISGELKGPKSRVIASSISAKNSITIGSAGSRVTEKCTLAAGRDDHIVLQTRQIDNKIEVIKKELNELREIREQTIVKEGRIFKKMVQLKRFHDNTEKKKKQLEGNVTAGQENNKKTKTLVKKLTNKMKTSVNSLKALNGEKKKGELRLKQIGIKIEKIQPKIDANIAELEKDRAILLSWASGKAGLPEIKIKTRAAETTLVKGVFLEKVLARDFKNIIVKEKTAKDTEGGYSIKIIKGNISNS